MAFNFSFDISSTFEYAFNRTRFFSHFSRINIFHGHIHGEKRDTCFSLTLFM